MKENKNKSWTALIYKNVSSTSGDVGVETDECVCFKFMNKARVHQTYTFTMHFDNRISHYSTFQVHKLSQNELYSSDKIDMTPIKIYSIFPTNFHPR